MPTGNYMGIGYGYVQSVEPSCLMGARFQYVTPSLQRVLGNKLTLPTRGEIRLTLLRKRRLRMRCGRATTRENEQRDH